MSWSSLFRAMWWVNWSSRLLLTRVGCLLSVSLVLLFLSYFLTWPEFCQYKRWYTSVRWGPKAVNLDNCFLACFTHLWQVSRGPNPGWFKNFEIQTYETFTGNTKWFFFWYNVRFFTCRILHLHDNNRKDKNTTKDNLLEIDCLGLGFKVTQ